MNAMVELLGEMRGRVPMYVGTNSVAKLAPFLRGYQYALEKQGLGRDADFLSAFQELAQSRYGVKTSKAWEDISPSFRVPMIMRRWERFCACMMTIVRGKPAPRHAGERRPGRSTVSESGDGSHPPA